MEILSYALAGLAFIAGLVLSKYITELFRRWSDKLKETPPQPPLISKITFEFPYLQISKINENACRLDMCVACGNANEKSVNVGIMKLNIGRHQNTPAFKDAFTLNNNSTALQSLTAQAKNGYVGETKIWSTNITMEQAKAILMCVDPHGGFVYVEIRIRCMDDEKYWPDNSKSVNPDEGWKGAVKIVDHSLQLETIAILATGIESMAEDINELVDEQKNKSHPDMPQSLVRLCGKSLGLRSTCEQIPGIIKR